MKTLIAAGAALLVAGAAAAQDNPMVGGAPMLADQPVAVNASNAPNLTTLVAAVEAAGLVETLAGPGNFTVFAPTDDAFAALPAGTVDTLLLPENRDQLTRVLTGHVVADELFSSEFMQLLANGGVARLTTVAGTELEARMSGSTLEITDEMGNTATVEIADVDQSNGVVHVIDAVLLPAASQ